MGQDSELVRTPALGGQGCARLGLWAPLGAIRAAVVLPHSVAYSWSSDLSEVPSVSPMATPSETASHPIHLGTWGRPGGQWAALVHN